jgi:hypothetical protein
MFHLLVKYDGWALSRDSIPHDRVFEHTHAAIVEHFRPAGSLDIDRITSIPALFMSESKSKGKQEARAGYITHAKISTKNVIVEYGFYEGLPPIPNSTLEELSTELDIDKWEFSRTHWSIKNVDLFRVLLGTRVGALPSPRLFKLDRVDGAEDNLLSVMMPFDSRFDNVYATIEATAQAMKMQCLRADNIWKDETIIQDIVSLINSSRIIVCDCTGRNANVFYEVGIAHTLGRQVILITQSEGDIPFDLRHLRYVMYLNNSEGRTDLAERIEQRIKTLLKATRKDPV